MKNTDIQDPTTWLLNKRQAANELAEIEAQERSARAALSRDTLARMARRFAARFKDKHGNEPSGHFATHTLAH